MEIINKLHELMLDDAHSHIFQRFGPAVIVILSQRKFY